MSDDPGLQFDRAEYESAPTSPICEHCQQPLASTYYQINGQVACPACAERLRTDRDGGSRAGRVGRATGAGLVATVLGALLYFGIGAMTGYEFGLIAIVVGFAVGAAVRWGSKGRGGWAYQTLAVALTYLAIVSTYIPAIVEGFRQAETAQSQAASGAGAPPAAAAAAPDTPPTAAQMTLALAILFVIACAAPFLAGFQNIIGIVIIGIGLYEAWKLNRRVPFEMSGPHAVAAPVSTV